MRLRSAKRLSLHRYVSGWEKFDWWKIIADCNWSHSFKQGVHTLEVRRGQAVLRRHHRSLWWLIYTVAQLLTKFNCTIFQGREILYLPMSNPLSAAVSTAVRERQWVRRVGLSGFRHFHINTLRGLPKPHPEVEKSIDYHTALLPGEIQDAIDQYEHSSEVKDINRLVPAYTVLTDRPPHPVSEDVLWDGFVASCFDFPWGEDGETRTVPVKPVTLDTLNEQVQTRRSAGLLNLNSLFGAVEGNKEEMREGAIAVNWQDANALGLPPAKPCRCSLKSEVIKKSKNVRGIMVDSAATYMILKHFFECLVQTFRDPSSGIAIGLSSSGGDFKQILCKWYLVLLESGSDMSWNEFLEWLEQQPMHESDKTAWEASTNENDGFPFIVSLLAAVDIPDDEPSKRLLARDIAGYISPIVQVDRDECYCMDWRVPSGTYKTAYGNSKRHRVMVEVVCMWLARHGRAGFAGCLCGLCDKLVGVQGFGEPVTSLDLALLMSSFVLGDDFISVNKHAHVFDVVMDNLFGTTTKTEVKRMFGDPGEGFEWNVGDDSVEFLRRRFKLDKSAPTYNVRTYREPVRVLAKLFKGDNRGSVEKFAAALDSALYECGANEPLFRLLFKLRHEVAGFSGIDYERYRDALKKFLGKNPGLQGHLPEIVPDYKDILAAESPIVTSLARAMASTSAYDFGMAPAMV